MRVSMGERSGQQSAAFLEQVLARIRTVPEVTAAGSIHFLPLRDCYPQRASGETTGLNRSPVNGRARKRS